MSQKFLNDIIVLGSDGSTATIEGSGQSTLNLKTTTNSKNNYIVGSTSGSLSFRPNGTETLTLNSQQYSTFASRVGIGVSASTNAMLDVKGPDTNNAVLGRFWSNTGARGSFIIRNGTGVDPTTFIGTAGGSEELSIGTNNTEAIRILASNSPGNSRVGIGTSTPTSQVHIKNTSGDNRGLKIENTVTTSYSELSLKAARDFRIGTGGSGTNANAASVFYVYDATAGGTAGHRFEISSDGDVQARRVRSNTAGDVALSLQPSDSTIHYGFRIDTSKLILLTLDRSGTNLQLLRVDYYFHGNATFTGSILTLGANYRW